MSPTLYSLVLATLFTSPISAQRISPNPSDIVKTIQLDYDFSSSNPLIAITGSSAAGVLPNATASTASTRPRPTNSQPCNGHIEFCDRKFSNITMVVAHNSPFVVPNNAASNQDMGVINQLNDGIRGLQFETHQPNTTSPLHLCHTSCTLLDAGPLESYLHLISTWLSTHPHEVLTLIICNADRVPPTSYIEPFARAGLLPYIYTPPSTTLTLSEWPTLSSMIQHNKRIVVMLDYLTNQTQIPWLLSEFSYQWETRFSPTDPAFPCTVHRPPNQAIDVSRESMYMANHNLNIEVPLFAGQDPLLVPAYPLLDDVNAVAGDGSLGRMVEACAALWGRPPNWLLVDYYHRGDFEGSVFQVAARANRVRYDRASCCSAKITSGARRRRRLSRAEKYSLVSSLMVFGLM